MAARPRTSSSRKGWRSGRDRIAAAADQHLVSTAAGPPVRAWVWLRVRSRRCAVAGTASRWERLDEDPGGRVHCGRMLSMAAASGPNCTTFTARPAEGGGFAAMAAPGSRKCSV